MALDSAARKVSAPLGAASATCRLNVVANMYEVGTVAIHPSRVSQMCGDRLAVVREVPVLA